MLFPLYDLNPHERIPWLTVLIIVINIAVTGWTSTLTPQESNYVAIEHGFVPERLTELGSGKPIQVPLLREVQGQVVQAGAVAISTDASRVYAMLFTTMFLHGGWGHLVMNMWMLWIFGNNIEDRLGHFMYVCFYCLGGVVASLCHWITDQHSLIPVVGASGAVAAVLGGYAITYPHAKVRTFVFFFLIAIVDLPALVVLGIWFLLQVFSGIVLLQGVPQEPVAFWAHIGGFVVGMILMPILSLGASPPGTDWRQETEALFSFEDTRKM